MENVFTLALGHSIYLFWIKMHHFVLLFSGTNPFTKWRLNSIGWIIVPVIIFSAQVYWRTLLL